MEGAGVAAHRSAGGQASERQSDKAAAARFQLIGNAVTVQARHLLLPLLPAREVAEFLNALWIVCCSSTYGME